MCLIDAIIIFCVSVLWVQYVLSVLYGYNICSLGFVSVICLFPYTYKFRADDPGFIHSLHMLTVWALQNLSRMKLFPGVGFQVPSSIPTLCELGTGFLLRPSNTLQRKKKN